MTKKKNVADALALPLETREAVAEFLRAFANPDRSTAGFGALNVAADILERGATYECVNCGKQIIEDISRPHYTWCQAVYPR